MSNDNVRFQEDVTEFFKIYRADVLQKPLGVKKTNEILKHAISDYFAKKINAQQLESIATQLYYELNTTSEVNGWNSELSGVLQRLTDLGYYVENSKIDLVKKIEQELRNYLQK